VNAGRPRSLPLAYVVAHPFDRVLVWTLPALFLRIPALGLLGVWFILQALEGAYALSNPGVTVGTAFMAHVGGFLVGAIAQLVYERRLGTLRAVVRGGRVQ
jgi:membrane associated rhomboid family serine protease